MILSSLLLVTVIPDKVKDTEVGGVIVIAFVWEKIRPVIVIKSENGGKFFFAISHSTKRKEHETADPRWN